MDKMAVVGAGAMGGGIAYLFSSAGWSVLIKDVDPRQLDLAREHIERLYRRRVERGQLDEATMQERLAHIVYTLQDEGFSDVDLVVEAVPEQMAIKQRVLSQLDRICKPDTILASNTSSLSIGEMGRAAGRPRRMIGMHFFNPAHVMKLVEVIPGAETEAAVVQAVVQLAVELGKTPVVVRDAPGFLVNRLLLPYLNEAVVCLQERAALPAEIDAAMGRDGFGWPMGPFMLMDMLGLDVCHHIMAYLEAHYGPRLQEAALLKAMYEAGRLGQKNGQGFYDHPDYQPAPAVDDLIARLSAGSQVTHPGSAFSPDRLMDLLLNEAVLCVAEKVAGVEDIDTACMAGLGMAVRIDGTPRPMGPLAYAEQVGLDVVLARLRQKEQAYGRRFRPAPLLEVKVGRGETGFGKDAS